jgi:PIN domain nuclease of toxin-antitoxin system
MPYLLDTHTFLWFVAGDTHLPTSVKNKIRNFNHACFLSIVSLWEITIKYRLGKLKLGIPLSELFDYPERNQLGIIPIEREHLLLLSDLPNHHQDPFDRTIVAQAVHKQLTILSKDKILKKYPVKFFWA